MRIVSPSFTNASQIQFPTDEIEASGQDDHIELVLGAIRRADARLGNSLNGVRYEVQVASVEGLREGECQHHIF